MAMETKSWTNAEVHASCIEHGLLVTSQESRAIRKLRRMEADDKIVTHFVLTAFALLLPTDPSSPLLPRAEEQTFLKAVGLAPLKRSSEDIWKVANPAPFAWMNAAPPVSSPNDPINFGSLSFQQILERVAGLEEQPRMGAGLPGVIADPGRWFYKKEMTGGGLYKRRTKIEVPDPDDVWSPYAGRNWMAQERLSIPVPVPLPVAEQLYVYGQIEGSGDALNNVQTSIYGKTGIGVKWALPAKSELQLRYGTLFSYADPNSAGRFQERAQPAVEVMARMPIYGPLEIEYTGAAVPAVTRTDTDQLRQELRLALPLRGDNELEFGARYRWDYLQQTTPWADRATLFLGVKFRH